MSSETSVDIVVRDIGGWLLAFSAGDEEPRIRDIDLAVRLNYATPIDIRKLIRRMIGDGKISNVKVIATVAKTSGGRPGSEYWLTEAQALKVAARSETEPADALLDEMIHVFQLARRGQLPTQQPAFSEERLITLLDRHADLVAAKVLAKLDEKPLTGTVGGAGGREIKCKLRRYGYLMAGAGSTKDVKSWRSSADTELRAKLGHTGAGSAWDELPLGMLASARRILDEMLRRAQRIAGERAQIDLPIPPPKAA